MRRMYEWTPDECIPEFYTDARVFASLHADMPDLALPEWAPTPAAFVAWHAAALEAPPVSAALNRWIDLNFGWLLAGVPAVDALNVSLVSARAPAIADRPTDRARAQPKAPDHGDALQALPLFVQLFGAPHPSRVVAMPAHLATARYGGGDLRAFDRAPTIPRVPAGGAAGGAGGLVSPGRRRVTSSEEAMRVASGLLKAEGFDVGVGTPPPSLNAALRRRMMSDASGAADAGPGSGGGVAAVISPPVRRASSIAGDSGVARAAVLASRQQAWRDAAGAGGTGGGGQLGVGGAVAQGGMHIPMGGAAGDASAGAGVRGLYAPVLVLPSGPDALLARLVHGERTAAFARSAAPLLCRSYSPLGEPAGPRADMHALGVVVAELFSGGPAGWAGGGAGGDRGLPSDVAVRRVAAWRAIAAA